MLHYVVSNILITAQFIFMANTSDLLVMGPFFLKQFPCPLSYLIRCRTKAKTPEGTEWMQPGITVKRYKQKIIKGQERNNIKTRKSSFLSYIFFYKLLSHVIYFPLSGLFKEVPKVPPDPSVCRQWNHQREPKQGWIYAGNWEALGDRHWCPTAS